MRMNPGIKVTEVVKQIAKLWQSLTKEEKQHFKEAAKLGKYFRFQIFHLDKERYIKELRELTKSNKTLEKPKKPLTPYMLFVREVSKNILFSTISV